MMLDPTTQPPEGYRWATTEEAEKYQDTYPLLWEPGWTTFPRQFTTSQGVDGWEDWPARLLTVDQEP